MPYRILIAACLVTLSTITGGGFATAKEPVPGLYQRLRQASVEVLVDGHLAGSGCIVDATGIVLTAAHNLTDGDAKVEIRSPAAGRLPATPLAFDLGHDLALLKLPRRAGRDYPWLPPADQPAEAGQVVYLFGSAVYRHAVMLRGTMARSGVTFEYVDGHYIEVIHVTGPAPIGTSGGPWVNERGQIVGVQSANIDIGQGSTGIAIVASLNGIREFLKIRRTKNTPSMDTAFEELWEQGIDFLGNLTPGTQGLVVRELKNGGAAARAGLQESDIIVHVEGQPVRETDRMLKIIRSKKPGELIRLRVVDDQGRRPRNVTLKLNSLMQDGEDRANQEVPE